MPTLLIQKGKSHCSSFLMVINLIKIRAWPSRSLNSPIDAIFARIVADSGQPISIW